MQPHYIYAVITGKTVAKDEIVKLHIKLRAASTRNHACTKLLSQETYTSKTVCAHFTNSISYTLLAFFLKIQ
uniref:Uncharacterized protein n=1 Tax=Arundo donax TaxID=35708 RepID=A0A0A9DT21_ARUDO